MLAFHQFEKSYNGRKVVSIPELHLSPGLYHLIGQNGSGKTTLIKSIAGLIPFHGNITLHDIPCTIKYQRAYRKLVSFTPSEPSFPNFMKGIDLIQLHQNLRGVNQELDHNMMEVLGVYEFRNQEIMGYSSGMIKKLALALAFLGAPKLIILDEPLNALDKEAAERLLPVISSYENSGSSFIITSHQAFDWGPNNRKQLSIIDSQITTG